MERWGARLARFSRSSKSNVDSPPPCEAAYARKNDPKSASAIPTEHIIKYFQVASKERALWLKYRLGAVAKVVASMATHINPKWCDRITRVIIDKEIKRQAQSVRFVRSRRRAR
jgi:hypothetical protein